jgi:DNA-binding MarR family transcriptional regulator
MALTTRFSWIYHSYYAYLSGPCSGTYSMSTDRPSNEPRDDVLDETEDQIVSSLRKLMRSLDSYSRRLRDEFGLTAPQLLLLRELERQTEMTAGGLSRALHLGQPTIKVILDRLESSGLVERSRHSEDRRSLHIRLTPPGRDLVHRAPPLLHEEFRRKLALQEDWERSMIVSVMQRVASMMELEPSRTTRDH